MICRNCKFSLQGNENFCPNCGAPLSEEESEKSAQQITPPPAPEIFFTPVRQNIRQENPVFRNDAHTGYADPPLSEKKRRRSPRAPFILLLVMLIAVLVMGIFAAAEHFDVAPVIMQYLSGTPSHNSTQATEPDTEKAQLTDTGIIVPEISYTPTQAFVSNKASLSLRKGPSDSYGLVRSLTSGCQLQILGGTVNDEIWVYVYIPYHDCYGWLNSSFITLYNTLEDSSPTEEEKTQATDLQ